MDAVPAPLVAFLAGEATVTRSKPEGKRDRPRDPDESRATGEALELVALMNEEINGIVAFLAAEEADLRSSTPSPKRLARLRLMSEDLVSAGTFAAKLLKN